MGEVFMKNYQEHSEYLVWQYIGTPQGVMRTYPAMSLYPLSRTNFDVRKRPWYNAGRESFSIHVLISPLLVSSVFLSKLKEDTCNLINGNKIK